MNKPMLNQSTRMVVGISLQAILLSGAWAYEVMDVKNGGTITGEVKFTGTPPTPEKITVTKDQEVCGKTEKVDESLLVGSNGELQNVVVSITDITKGKKMDETAATLDQKDCRYAPHIVLLPAGAVLKILNSDGILHNIHTSSTKNPPFNRAQPKFKKEIDEKFISPETVKLACDVHGWMSGWLIVEDHPYYAVTDANGSFKITDVPPGNYELKFWQETLRETTQKVSVKPNEEVKVSVQMAKK
jgi:plastocyanin